jgi:hypothetical protein
MSKSYLNICETQTLLKHKYYILLENFHLRKLYL